MPAYTEVSPQQRAPSPQRPSWADVDVMESMVSSDDVLFGVAVSSVSSRMVDVHVAVSTSISPGVVVQSCSPCGGHRRMSKVRRLNAIATRVQPEHMLTCAVPSSTFVFIFFSPLFSVGVGTLYCAIRTVAQANQGNTVRRAARGPRHKRARVSGAHYEQRAVQQGKPSS